MSGVAGRPTAALRSDRGAAAMTAWLAALLVLAATLPVVLGVADALLTAGRARGAADAAALAVLSGSPLADGIGQPDVAAGQAVAQANGATLVDVEADSWPIAVTVHVAATTTGPLRHLVPELPATAAARLVPP